MPKLITVGEVIDRSWEHYRKFFLDLMSISGWLLLLAAFEIASLIFFPTSTKLLTGGGLDGSESFGVILFTISSYVIAPLLGIWTLAALVRLISQQLGKTKVNLRKAMQEGWQFFLPTLVVSLLVALVLIAGIAIGVGPGFLLALLAVGVNNTSLLIIANLLVAVGIFVALVLNIRWSVNYIMTPYALLVENYRGTSALTRSHNMIRGKFLNILVLILVPKVVFILFGIAAMFVLGYIVNLLLSIPIGLNIDLQLRLFSMTSSIISIVVAALINPLIIIADVLIYNSLKDRAAERRRESK